MTIITTLHNGELTLDSIQYKFIDNNLTLRIVTTDPHKIYGSVDVNLTDVSVINVYTKLAANYNRVLVEDYFAETTFSFSRIDETTLECQVSILSGITESATFIDLPTETAITAYVANGEIILPAGKYNFSLLETEDTEFSTSLIFINQIIEEAGVDGIKSIFNEDGAGDYLSINGQDLTFLYPVNIGIQNDDEGVTNIPLVITSI